MYDSLLSDFLISMDTSVVLLEKETEVLELMIQHGIMESLCELFCTCEDEDTLVCRLCSFFL